MKEEHLQTDLRVSEFFSSELEIYGRNLSWVYVTSVWKALWLLWREDWWIIGCKHWHRKDYWYHQGQSNVSIRGGWRQILCHLLTDTISVTWRRVIKTSTEWLAPSNQIHNFYKFRKTNTAKKKKTTFTWNTLLFSCYLAEMKTYLTSQINYQLIMGIY